MALFVAYRTTESAMEIISPTKFTSVRFQGVALGNHSRGHWAFYDVSGDRPAQLQPVYRTKAEALADMERQATGRGWSI